MVKQLLWVPLLSWTLLWAACDGTEAAPTGVLYVDAEAAPGGDGSPARPFVTVREALEAVADNHTILVAAGTYPVPVSWQFSSALLLSGETGGQTHLVGEETMALEGTGLRWQGPPAGAKLALRSLSFALPLQVSGGELSAQQLHFSEIVGTAFELIGASASLRDVTIAGVSAAIEPASGSDGVTVTDGALTWTGGGVSAVADRGLVLTNSTAELADLALTGGRRPGLAIEAQSEARAARLAIADAPVGIYVSGATLELTASTIERAGTAGILASGGSTVTVVDSNLRDCPNGHIAITGADTAATFERNEISGAAASPCVFINGASRGLLLRDNVVTTCAGAGISLGSLEGSAVVEQNTISDILPDPLFAELAEGIEVHRSAATLTDNVIHDAAGSGISLVGASATVSGNQIYDVARAGISVVEPGAAASTLADNTITSALGAGIILLNTTATLTNNEISATRYSATEQLGDGIVFGDGATVSVIGNATNNNSRNGIVFLDGAHGEIRENTATGNALYGILEFCTGPANDVVVGVNTLGGNTAGDSSLCSAP